MAVKLSSDLRKVLNASGRVTDDSTNPDNLSKLNFQPLNLIYRPHHGYTEDEADQSVDSLTTQAEFITQENRVIDAQTAVAKAYNVKLGKLDKLRKEIAQGMKTIAGSYAEWQSLIHEVQIAERQGGVDLRVRTEKANIQLEAHQRGLKQQLQAQTDISRRGTHAGSAILNRRPTPIAGNAYP